MPTYKAVRLEHRGGMAFHAEPSSGHPMDFDDRESNTGASPVETVLSALAACSGMDVVSILAKKRQDVAAYRVEVTGTQRDEYPQVYSEVVMIHEFEGHDLSEAAIRRAIELSALKYCPVNAMLSAGATEVHHRYRIRSRASGQAEGEVLVTGPYRRPVEDA
jgi:putative redox protein